MKINKLIIILTTLLIISCKDDNFKTFNIDVPKWTKTTMDDARLYCNLKNNDYRKNLPAVIRENGDTLRVNSHLESILEVRKQFAKQLLDKNLLKGKKVTIIEYYNRGNESSINYNASYKVFLEDYDQLYYFYLDDFKKSFLVERKVWDNPENFSLEGNVKCINDLSVYSIGYVRIKNSIYKEASQTIYKTDYIYLEGVDSE